MSRNYDPVSLEKRVYNMDGAKMRNYDLFSLEKRIYDLEQGGTPGPSPAEAIVFQHFYNDPLTGSHTFERDARLYLTMASQASEANFAFKVNGESVMSEISNNMIGTASGFNFSYIDVEKDDVLTWELANANRYFSAVGV